MSGRGGGAPTIAPVGWVPVLFPAENRLVAEATVTFTRCTERLRVRGSGNGR